MTGSIRYVLRNLARRRTRTVVGALGIFLTVGFLTAIQIGLDSVSLSYVDLAALQAGRADIFISAENSQPFRPDEFDPAPVLSKLADHPRLRGLSPRLLGLARVRTENDRAYAYLIGVDAARERELEINGFTPDPDLDGRSCALSADLAKRLKLEKGGEVRVRGAERGREQTLRLGTIVEKQLVFPQQIREFVVVDVAAARAALSVKGAHVLAGAFRDPRSYYDARDLHASILLLRDAGEAIAEDLGMKYKVELPKAAAITAFQNVSAPLRAVFGVFALLALVITGLLIYSLVSVGVEERIREFAILRTLGARRGYVFGLVLLESGLLCLLGVVPGVLCGTLVAQGIVNIVELAMGAEGDPITLAFSGSTLWLCLAMGAALSIGSSLLPALSAVRRRIVDALDPLRRGQAPNREPKEGAINRPLLLTGLALAAISVVTFFILPTAFLSGDPSLIGAVVLGLLLMTLLGFTLVAVGAMPLVETIVMGAIGWAFGGSAELARRNLARHRRRNVTTSLMFTLSVSFVLFIASLVALFSRTSMAMLERGNGADLRIHSSRPFAFETKDELAGIDGVDGVSGALVLRGRTREGVAYEAVLSDILGLKHLWIVPYGIDPDLPDVVFREQARFEEGGAGALEKMSADGEETYPPLILSLSAARFMDVHAGDLVRLSFLLGAGRVEEWFRVEAVCSAFPGFSNFRSRTANAVGSGVLLSMDTFRDLTRDAPEEAFQGFYFVKAGPEEREVAREIRDQFGLRYGIGVQSTAEQKSQAVALYWATQVFFGLLLAVAVLIAVFSLIASMATTVLERRWEIGVLKALGLRRKHLFRIFLGEAVALTLSAGLAGGATGFLLAYLFVLQAAALAEVPVVFTLPYITFFATFAVSVVAGALAAWLPTKRLLRRSAAEILRTTD